MRYLGFAIVAGLFTAAALAGCGGGKSDEDKMAVRLHIDPIGKSGELMERLAVKWEQASGQRVQLVKREANSSVRLAEIMQHLESRSSGMDLFMIDVIWPPLLHQKFEDLSAAFSRERSQFAPELIENNTIHGRLVALPFYVDAGLFYYRRDLLDKYGYADPPVTWAEMEEMARRIMEGERQEGRLDFWGLSIDCLPQESLTCTALEWIASDGGGTIVEDSGTISINNPRAAAALDRAAGWIGTIASPASLTMEPTAARDFFRNGNAVFCRNWSHAWSLFNDPSSPIAGKVGVAPMPGGTEGTRSTMGGWHLAVPVNSPHKEQATAMALFLTSAESQRMRALDGGFPPTRPDVYNDPAIQARNPHLLAIRDSLPTLLRRPSRQTGARYNEVSAIFFTLTAEVLRGGSSGVEAVAEMERRLTIALKR
jgi:trehalose/maltose transport system substrate-binding protein